MSNVDTNNLKKIITDIIINSGEGLLDDEGVDEKSAEGVAESIITEIIAYKDSMHPVRFTKDQIAFLRHLFYETGFDYFEEECLDLVNTIKKAEKESR